MVPLSARWLPSWTPGPGSRSAETSTRRHLWKSSNLGTIKGCRAGVPVMRKSLTWGWSGEAGRTLEVGSFAGAGAPVSRAAATVGQVPGAQSVTCLLGGARLGARRGRQGCHPRPPGRACSGQNADVLRPRGPPWRWLAYSPSRPLGLRVQPHFLLSPKAETLLGFGGLVHFLPTGIIPRPSTKPRNALRPTGGTPSLVASPLLRLPARGASRLSWGELAHMTWVGRGRGGEE